MWSSPSYNGWVRSRLHHFNHLFYEISGAKRYPKFLCKALRKFWSMASVWSALLSWMGFWSSVAEGCVRVSRSKHRCRKTVETHGVLNHPEGAIRFNLDRNGKLRSLFASFRQLSGNEVRAKLKISSLRKGGLPFNPTRKCLGLRTMRCVSEHKLTQAPKPAVCCLEI